MKNIAEEILWAAGLVAFATISTIGLGVGVEKMVNNHNSVYQAMGRIADDSSLHPTYGNNNSILENEEIREVAKEMNYILNKNYKTSNVLGYIINPIPLKVAKKYVKKYESLEKQSQISSQKTTN